MTKKWSLKEIRESYRDILLAYDAVFSISPDHREGDVESGGFNFDEKNFYQETKVKMEKVLPELKEKADHSGNAVVWRRGDSLCGLSGALRQRIETGLKYGR